MMKRSAGVLLHVTSLPSPYGIGDLGPVAYGWIDALSAAKVGWWQILPLVATGEGYSPYSGASAFGGNPLLISPKLLHKDGLIARDDLASDRFPQERVDYPKVVRSKQALLHRAFDRFNGKSSGRLKDDFEKFKHREANWLDDLTLFLAIKESRGGRHWNQWPRDLAVRKPAAIRVARNELAESIGRHAFAQFLFDRQISALRDYCRIRNVGLIGDLPIFVALDSADVWANAHQFRLDRHGQPKVVAGVPPDYFSATGQRWGNPHYDWKVMERDGFAWWIARVKATLRQVDLVRLDHFRGFDAAWAVPARCPTAQQGKWEKAPGASLMATFRRTLGELPFIAEDLGVITPSVDQLRDDFGLPGMRVLQFAFGGDSANCFLPHHYPRNAVAYTGTHDNDTTVGWYRSLKRHEKAALEDYCPGARKDVASALVRLAWASVADLAVAPMQDVLSLGHAARMNVPGKAKGNWAWRATEAQLHTHALDDLADLTHTYSRAT